MVTDLESIIKVFTRNLGDSQSVSLNLWYSMFAIDHAVSWYLGYLSQRTQSASVTNPVSSATACMSENTAYLNYTDQSWHEIYFGFRFEAYKLK
jgi:hypothetical protein